MTLLPVDLGATADRQAKASHKVHPGAKMDEDRMYTTGYGPYDT